MTGDCHTCITQFIDWNSTLNVCNHDCHKENNNVNETQGPEEASEEGRASRTRSKQKRKTHQDNE